MTTPLTIVHTSDWHLGHELHTHPREAEHDAFLAWLLDRLEASEADCLLVAGDIYDVANPPTAAIQRLFRFLRDAMARMPCLQIVITGGNHDSAARVDLPGALVASTRLHLVGNLPRREGEVNHDRLFAKIAGRDGESAAFVAAVPFCRPGDYGAAGLAGLYSSIIEEGALRADGLPLVVMGHLHVAGGEISERSERNILVGGEEAQASSLFDDRCAYVALGHLHRPQQIKGPCPIRYSGSPFPLSATERDYRHSIAVVRIADGSTEVELEPIPRPAPFIAVPPHGSAPLGDVLEELRALSARLDPDTPREFWPFLEITVATDGPQPFLQHEIQQAIRDLPVRLTRIVRQSVHQSAEPTAWDGKQIEEMEPAEIFAALHRDEGHGDPGDDLLSAFAELVDAARQEDA